MKPYSEQYAPTGIDKPLVSEILLFIDNDSGLYHQRVVPVQKNLATKYAKGVYDHAKARKLWMYTVEDALRRYMKMTSAKAANRATREEIARVLEEATYEDIKNGQFNHLLPKKYKKNPGARWHAQQAHTARTLEDASKRKSRKHFYRGQGRAHLMSAVMAKRMGMNPPRRRRKRRCSTRR